MNQRKEKRVENVVKKKGSEKLEIKRVAKQKRVLKLWSVQPICGITSWGPANNPTVAKLIPDEYRYVPPDKVVSFKSAWQKHDDCWGDDVCQRKV